MIKQTLVRPLKRIDFPSKEEGISIHPSIAHEYGRLARRYTCWTSSNESNGWNHLDRGGEAEDVVRGLAGGAGAAAEAGPHGLLLLGQRLQQLLHVLAAAEDALPHPRHEPPLPPLQRRRRLRRHGRLRGRRGRRRGGGGRVAFGHAPGVGRSVGRRPV